MGWLWNTTHDIFDADENYSEICICSLTPEQVVAGYNFIRSKCRRLRGTPTFYSYETLQETGLDEIGNAAEFVCRRKAKPFHFISATIRLDRGILYDLGFFILDNAIAIDFQRGKLWGELEIETLMRIIMEIRKGASDSFLQLPSTAAPEYRGRIEEALIQLAKEDEEEKKTS